ncbi:unnamed protein product, partial [Chrysoparadoxa australica]
KEEKRRSKQVSVDLSQLKENVLQSIGDPAERRLFRLEGEQKEQGARLAKLLSEHEQQAAKLEEKLHDMAMQAQEAELSHEEALTHLEELLEEHKEESQKALEGMTEGGGTGKDVEGLQASVRQLSQQVSGMGEKFQQSEKLQETLQESMREVELRQRLEVKERQRAHTSTQDSMDALKKAAEKRSTELQLRLEGMTDELRAVIAVVKDTKAEEKALLELERKLNHGVATMKATVEEKARQTKEQMECSARALETLVAEAQKQSQEVQEALLPRL